MNYAPELSGTAPYTTTWAQHLARWADVLVVAGLPHLPQWRVLDGYGGWREEHLEYGVPVRRLRHLVPRSGSPAQRLTAASSFGARVLTERVPEMDGVLAVTPPLLGAAAALRVARRRGVPFGLVAQDLQSHDPHRHHDSSRDPGGPAGRAAAEMEVRIVRAAHRVLTISDRLREIIVGDIGAAADRVSVVGNWSQLPADAEARPAVRNRHGWGEEFIAMHAGTMGDRQGLDSVVAAARLADSRGAPVRFVLVGDGDRAADLRRRAAGLTRIDFLPPASPREHAGLLAAADVLVVNEAPGAPDARVPSKLTSYFAAGRPVVAAGSADGATAEVLRRSDAGIVVEAGDPAALLDAVLDLRADPATAARHAEAARRWGGAHHGVDDAMRGYDRWVQDLLASGAEAQAEGQ